jgi:hypothetical protein
MPKPKITVLGKFARTQKIARPVDNTDDLWAAETKARSKFAHISGPDNINPAHNGKTTTTNMGPGGNTSGSTTTS